MARQLGAGMERVVGLWQWRVQHVLSPARRRSFEARPEALALAAHSGTVLLRAALAVHRRTGQLVLAEWLTKAERIQSITRAEQPDGGEPSSWSERPASLHRDPQRQRSAERESAKWAAIKASEEAAAVRTIRREQERTAKAAERAASAAASTDRERKAAAARAEEAAAKQAERDAARERAAKELAEWAEEHPEEARQLQEETEQRARRVARLVAQHAADRAKRWADSDREMGY